MSRHSTYSAHHPLRAIAEQRSALRATIAQRQEQLFRITATTSLLFEGARWGFRMCSVAHWIIRLIRRR